MYFMVCSKDFSFIKPLYIYKIVLKNNMNKKKRKNSVIQFKSQNDKKLKEAFGKCGENKMKL